jgi:hypothetical protein
LWTRPERDIPATIIQQASRKLKRFRVIYTDTGAFEVKQHISCQCQPFTTTH